MARLTLSYAKNPKKPTYRLGLLDFILHYITYRGQVGHVHLFGPGDPPHNLDGYIVVQDSNARNTDRLTGRESVKLSYRVFGYSYDNRYAMRKPMTERVYAIFSQFWTDNNPAQTFQPRVVIEHDKVISPFNQTTQGIDSVEPWMLDLIKDFQHKWAHYVEEEPLLDLKFPIT